jgi:RNA polymerase sigma-70 factor (ECF subfamily)
MAPPTPTTEELLDRVRQGDDLARGQLLERHRARLRSMIALRLDRRLAARIDPSDVVQDSLAEADRRLSDYLQSQPLPFYPWLRQLALERLVEAYRWHIRSHIRSVRREDVEISFLPDESLHLLANQLAARGSSPSARLRQKDLAEGLKAALGRLSESDREVLVLRHLEQLSVRDIAAVLGLSESAVKMRQVRALERLRATLGADWKEDLS